MYWLALRVVESDWLITNCLEFSDEIAIILWKLTTTALASGRCLLTFHLVFMFKVIVSSLPYTETNLYPEIIIIKLPRTTIFMQSLLCHKAIV